jgi:hypothetical protein
MSIPAPMPIRDGRQDGTLPKPYRRGFAHGRLAGLRALALEAAAIHSGSPSGSSGGPVIVGAELTSTGIGLFLIASADEQLHTVVMVPTSPDAVRRLDREVAVLSVLQADDRLGDWRELVPVPRASGTLRGRRYQVNSALAGHPPTPGLGASDLRPALLTMAANAIDVLHRATARTVVADTDLIAQWVDLHLRELLPPIGGPRPLRFGLQRLRDELYEALAGQTLCAGWIHGDYWLGNLLCSSAEPGRCLIEGIVDWDASAPLELPVHDVAHLLLSTRRLLTGRELGHIVRDQLRGRGWALHERELLDRQITWRGTGSLTERHLLLLYWLRHAAMHARQQRRLGGCRYRWWEYRNVLPVLASL